MLNQLLFTLADSAVTDWSKIFSIVAIIGYSLAGLCLVLSVAIFFLYDIRGAYSYLTGRKQQKGISEMRKKQGEGGETAPASPSMKFGFSQAPKQVSNKRHSATVSQPAAPPPPPAPAAAPAGETAALDVQPSQSDIQSEEATGVLSPANTYEEESTGVLAPANTTEEAAEAPSSENSYEEEATGVLSPANDINNTVQETAESGDASAADEGETSVLSVNSPLGSFVLVKNEMVIHTDEVL